MPGYDVDTVTSNKPNMANDAPWLASLQHQSSCEPHVFGIGDQFRTNTSAFAYTIFNVWDSKLNTQFEYSDNDLSDCGCDVTDMTIQPSPGNTELTMTVRTSFPYIILTVS